MTEVAGVFTKEADEDPLKSGWFGTVPAGTRSTDHGQVVRLDDDPAARSLRSQCGDEVPGVLVRSDVPSLVWPVGPWLLDLVALETPLEPTQLDEPEGLDQFERGPA